MGKVQRDDESATPDQDRAREKREAGQARADAAAKDWRDQLKAGESTVGEERTAPPKGRKASPKSEA